MSEDALARELERSSCRPGNYIDLPFVRMDGSKIS